MNFLDPESLVSVGKRRVVLLCWWKIRLWLFVKELRGVVCCSHGPMEARGR